MTIGDRIKMLRTKKNISQTDFADSIDVSKQTLYKYENNIITNIPLSKIELIAKILNVSPGYIMGWDSDIKADSKNKSKEIEKIIEETIHNLENADGLMFDGKPATDEDLEQIKSAMRIGMAMAKEKAREKFTSKKYK